MDEERKKYPLDSVVLITVASVVIIILTSLFYYFSVFSPSVVVQEPLPVPKVKIVDPVVVPAVVPTNIVVFSPPSVLPVNRKSGNCWTSSIAEPFRKDAWRCMVASTIYDPCFETEQAGLVFCQLNPLSTTSVVIKLTKILSQRSEIENMQDNWAWFLTLKDGTYCSPFTGTRPFYGKDQIAYYGCKSNDKNKQIVLLGDLEKGTVWTANKVITAKKGTSWVIESTEKVDIDTVWQ